MGNCRNLWFDITFDIDNIYFEFEESPIKKLEKSSFLLQIGASGLQFSLPFLSFKTLNLSFEVADDNIDLLPKALGPTSDLLLCIHTNFSFISSFAKKVKIKFKSFGNKL